ncbi:MAG TPA: SBBP repeat-containing protein, partial [Terriglobia bacterium]|nr:SBBP repeat-containing protein [Terriglobia bacterium]
MQRRKCFNGATILLLLLMGAGIFMSDSAVKKTTSRDSIRSQEPGSSSDGLSAEETPASTPSFHGADSPGRRKAGNLQVSKGYGNLGMAFEPNQGQASDDVKFLSRGHGYTLYLTASEAVLQFPMADLPLPNDKTDRNTGFDWQDPHHFSVPFDFHQFAEVSNRLNRKSEIANRKSKTVHMKLLGANSKAEVEGVDKLPGITNYFIGNDPMQWRTNIPNYARVRFKDVFPGIDLAYYGNQDQLEFDFMVAPGADPSKVQLAFEGAERISRGNNGELLLKIGSSQLRMMTPYVYQVCNGRRLELDGRYVFKNEKKIGFAVDRYDPSLALVIDPQFVYSMTFGGTGGDNPFDIQVDSLGSAYVVGKSASLDFPTQNPFQSDPGGGTCGDLVIYQCTNVFVSKINPEGNGLIYSTYLGGNRDDIGTSLALDSSGNAYLTGSTTSTNFPTKSAIFPTLRDGGENCHRGQVGDAFVTELNPSGNALIYSTYLGGGCGDLGAGIAIDGARNVYVTGTTSSQTFPVTPGVFQNHPGGNEATNGFLAKINSNGNALAYSTFLGVAGSLFATMPSSVFVDPQGNAYVTGKTTASDFPTTPGAFQRQHGGAFDAFVLKLNSSGSALIYST